MQQWTAKWRIVLHSFAIVALLTVVRAVIDAYGYDVISTSPVITGFIGGVIFTIALILTGTLTDFKESEKIPGDLVASMRALILDTEVVPPEAEETAGKMRAEVCTLAKTCSQELCQGRWDLKTVSEGITRVTLLIADLARKNTAPPVLVKMRSELTTIDRIACRIETIRETSFIPAAYAVAEISAACAILVLLLVHLDPWYEGVVLFPMVSWMIIALLLLIRDMDNPFTACPHSYAKIDLALLENFVCGLGGGSAPGQGRPEPEPGSGCPEKPLRRI